MGKNRSIEAKRIKYIKQSKARPRYLRIDRGQMKVNQSVDRSKIPQEYLGLFAYRERAKHSVVEEFLEAKFPTRTNDREAQKYALRHSIIAETRFIRTLLFFDATEEFFYITELHTLPGVLRVSCTYNSRDRIQSVFHLKTIRWKEVIHVPNVDTKS